MELPLILAGPILRRVDPSLVAVWMAFSEPAELELRVWEGRVAHDTTNPVFASSGDPPDPSAPPPRPGAEAIRIGEHLHLGLVTARLPPASGKVFQPDRLYSYDVVIAGGGEILGLGERGLLATRTVNGVEVPPLGYDDRMLPSFALPPSELDHLRIAYGSCRRPGYDDGDALAWMDELLVTTVGDPRARIHQLFLGGDQIYADDVDSVMMLRVVELGIELIGRDGDNGPPIERVTVQQVLRRPAAAQPDPADPTASYVPETDTETAVAGDLPAGSAHFPVGQRLDVTQRNAQLTSIDGANHVISFGEFAALHLMVWSPAAWGELIPGAEVVRVGDTIRSQIRWLDTPEELGPIFFPEPDFPERIPEHLYADKETLAKRAKEAASEDEEEREKKAARSRGRSHRVHRDFLLGLGKVQRVLANVPTYMLLDDHDITDDLFLNPMWRRRVLGSTLGQKILTNGMLAYALFQDWGNDPRRYDQATDEQRPDLGGQLPGDLLVRAAGYFPTGRRQGPDAAAFTALAKMFGHNLDNAPDLDGRFRAVHPPLKWHFSVDGPKHRVVALDNRTRRSYAAEIGPPGNVSPEALVDQLPLPPLPAGREVLIVVAPLQVFGAGLLDEIVSPAIYRIFDLVKASERASDQVSGARRMPGTNPDALETWSLEPLAFEHLLERLAEYQPRGGAVGRRAQLDGQPDELLARRRNESRPHRPVHIERFQERDARVPARARPQRHAPARAAACPDRRRALRVGPPGGRPRAAAGRAQRGRSRRRHPCQAAAQPGPAPGPRLVGRQRSRRTNPGRADHSPQPRPSPRLALERVGRCSTTDPTPSGRLRSALELIDDAVVEAQLADPDQVFAALQTIAARHQSALDRMRNARQMMFRSNFGVCRFTTGTGGAITAVHELYTSAPDPETQLPVLDSLPGPVGATRSRRRTASGAAASRRHRARPHPGSAT